MASDPPGIVRAPDQRLPAPAEESESTRITASGVTAKGSDRPQRARAYLVVLAGTNLGEMHDVEAQEIIIGRSATSQLRLSDDGISRRHCRVILNGGRILIEDLGSANGTYVNGARVKQHELKDGDKIRIGATALLKFTYQDKSEEKFQKHMYDAALRDGLTKSYNKKFFQDRLEAEFAYATRHKALLSLLMVDVDHFKQVNDVHGHLAGDAVLVHLAQIIQTTIRAEDVAARYGGEEFAIICRGIPLLSAGILGERLRAVVEQANVEFGGKRIPVTISVGVAGLIETGAGSAADLVAHADGALYEAKRGGRNRVCFRGG